MPRPLTHSGDSINHMIQGRLNVIGMLVYVGGNPQRIGIIRSVRPDPRGYWNNEVQIEWPSGKKVWRHAGGIMSIDSKLEEEERVLRVLTLARNNAADHFRGI